MAKINWTEIQLRWLQGENSEAIAKDYKGVTGEAIRKRASRGKWSQLRDTVCHTAQNIAVNAAILQLSDIHNLALEVAKKALQSFLDNDVEKGNIPIICKALDKSWPDKKQDPNAHPSSYTYQRHFNVSSAHPAPNGNFASKPILPLDGRDIGQTERQNNSSD